MTELPGNHAAAMAEAVVETFENLAFMEPEYLPEERPVFDETAICCRLAILSPQTGLISLTIGKDLAATIAGTIWSLEPEDVEEQLCRDNVAEILNTVAGRFMKGATPEDQTFELGLPETLPCSAEAHSGWQAFPFSLEGGLFVISLKITG